MGSHICATKWHVAPTRYAAPLLVALAMLAGVVVASILDPTLVASAQTPSKSGPQPKAGANAPAVARDADQLLKNMGSYIGSASQFAFGADVVFDQVLPSGQKVQFSAAQSVALKRPADLYVDWTGDLGSRRFWYDGSAISLYDPIAQFYARTTAPPEIDSMLDTLVKNLDFSLPLVDFFYRDPYASVRANVQYGFDLGQAQVNGRACRSLAFVEKDIDWQIWIENGPQPTPCKLVITYKSLPAQPQFTATFRDWDFAPRIAATFFTANMPPGSEQIPLGSLAVTREQVGEKP